VIAATSRDSPRDLRHVVVPLVLAALVVVSWALRPRGLEAADLGSDRVVLSKISVPCPTTMWSRTRRPKLPQVRRARTTVDRRGRI